MLWCPLRYLHKTMFGSSLPPVVCRRNHVLFTLFVHSGVQHILTIWVTWWFLVRDGDYLPIAGAWVHPRFLVGSVLFIFLVFCVVFLLLFVFNLCLMCPVLTVSLDCPFFIAPSGFSDIYFQILRNSKKGILKFFVLLVSLSDAYIRSRRCYTNRRYTFSIS